MQTRLRPTLLIGIGLLLLGSSAQAGPKKTPAKGAPVTKTACGAKIIPLVEGSSWTYASVPAPTTADEKIAKLSPPPAKKIVITVKSVEAKGADTFVTLEETITNEINLQAVNGKVPPPKLVDRVVTTTITCNAKKFDISPNSFLFAGEPGGFLNMTFDKLERPRGPTWVIANGTLIETDWREDIAAHWTREPTEGANVKVSGGKLELERKFVPQAPELVVTKLDQYKAEKLGLVTTGRITLDPGQAHPDNKPMELPAGWTSQLWLVDNLGLVQALNNYAHMYQLVEKTLK